MDVSVSNKAYCKLILHASKYPHCAVNGVLLAEKPKSKENRSMKVVDAIPLFHLSLGLAPMMEVALTQIDAYCKTKGLVIGGYYQANERLPDKDPNPIAYKVSDRIHDNLRPSGNDLVPPSACILMVDNQKLSLHGDEEAYRLFYKHDEKWKEIGHKGTLEKGALAATASLIESKAYRQIVDFDNHLDNISLDWKNVEINELLKHTS